MSTLEMGRPDGTEDSRVGLGDWLEITQDMIDRFADLTGDHQWIHVDVERAQDGPYGATIAHGFLTLALVAQLSRSHRPRPPGTTVAVNYGLNRVRFPAPVRVGWRVRARTSPLDVTQVDERVVEVVYEITVEIAGAAKPACVAEMICRYGR
jgi:acyl dehydratase